jgi:hypothetical protein
MYIAESNFEVCIKAIENYHRKIQPNIACPGSAMAYPEKNIAKKLCYALSHFGWDTTYDDEQIWGIMDDATRVA